MFYQRARLKVMLEGKAPAAEVTEADLKRRALAADQIYLQEHPVLDYGLMIGWVITMMLNLLLIAQWFVRLRPWTFLALSLLNLLLVTVGWVTILRQRRFLKDAFARADAADYVRCIRCQYDLRHLKAAVCPECGEPFRAIHT